MLLIKSWTNLTNLTNIFLTLKKKKYFFPGIKNKESTKLNIIIFIISINHQNTEKYFYFLFSR
jgi:hypothetical protein